jgi:hypothetical protein
VQQISAFVTLPQALELNLLNAEGCDCKLNSLSMDVDTGEQTAFRIPKKTSHQLMMGVTATQ